MPEQAIKDKTAIVGIGWTAFSRNSGVTTLSLAAEASLKAIADAGLQVQDIDGVVSFYHRQPEGQMVRELVRALGLKKCNFEFYSDGGGGWNCGAVLSGAMLVHSGICKNVLVFKARNRYSQGRAARAPNAPTTSRATRSSPRRSASTMPPLPSVPSRPLTWRATAPRPWTLLISPSPSAATPRSTRKR